MRNYWRAISFIFSLGLVISTGPSWATTMLRPGLPFGSGTTDYTSSGSGTLEPYANDTSGDPVIIELRNLTVKNGHTISVQNTCRGLFIFVKGTLTIEAGGQISMTAKAYANGNVDDMYVLNVTNNKYLWYATIDSYAAHLKIRGGDGGDGGTGGNVSGYSGGSAGKGGGGGAYGGGAGGGGGSGAVEDYSGGYGGSDADQSSQGVGGQGAVPIDHLINPFWTCSGGGGGGGNGGIASSGPNCTTTATDGTGVGGGAIYMFSYRLKILEASSALEAKATGTGGNGGEAAGLQAAGGGGPGGGNGGGVIAGVYKILIQNDFTCTDCVDGSAAGTAGNGINGGSNGYSAQNGSQGSYQLIQYND